VALGFFAGAQSASAAPIYGQVNLAVGGTWLDQDSGLGNDLDEEFAGILGGAKVAVPYSSDVRIEVGVTGDSTFAHADNDDSYAGGFGANLHIGWHDASAGTLGVFGAVGRSTSIDEESSSFFAAGFAGQYFCDRWTFFGQLGYIDSSDDPDFLHNTGFVRAGAGYYLSKGLKFSADLLYADGEQDSNDGNAVVWGWGAAAEYWFGQSVPASVYIEYRGLDSETDADGPELGITTHTVNLGVRFHFNGGDLSDSDRQFNAELPNFSRILHEGGSSID
jgi:hypothetical protein